MKKNVFFIRFVVLYVSCLLLVGLPSRMQAQIKPVLNVPSPEVANLGQYKMVPVDYFTGIPNVSVPLYTVRVGNYSLPLSVSYHLSSVKPNTTPGCLGLGWSLIAGGYISRSVRCICDEKMGKDGIAHGFYDHSEKIKNMTEAEFVDHTLNHAEGKDYYELSADEFTFNFCGYSGSFYYNEDKGWTVISDQDIQVEFDSNSGFADFAEVAQRIGSSRWNNSSQNNRYFIKFTIITPDGCRYEFGGINATEFCIPYYSRSNHDLVATSWMLTKITTLEGRTIQFDYSAHTVMANIKYVPQYSLTYDFPVAKKHAYQIGRKGFTGFLLFGVNLSSISTVNETISFDYERDEHYGQYFNVRTPLLCWKDDVGDGSNIPNRLEPFVGLRTDLYAQATQLLNVSGFNDAVSDQERSVAVGNALVCNYLHRMTIKGKGSGDRMSIYFGYVQNKNRKLSLITFREGVPELKYESLADGTKKPQIPTNSGVIRASSLPEYRFSYDTTMTMPLEYGFLGTDSWGYYNGQTISITSYPDFQGTPYNELLCVVKSSRNLGKLNIFL